MPEPTTARIGRHNFNAAKEPMTFISPDPSRAVITEAQIEEWIAFAERAYAGPTYPSGREAASAPRWQASTPAQKREWSLMNLRPYRMSPAESRGFDRSICVRVDGSVYPNPNRESRLDRKMRTG